LLQQHPRHIEASHPLQHFQTARTAAAAAAAAAFTTITTAPTVATATITTRVFSDQRRAFWTCEPWRQLATQRSHPV
jgi:hypothetical protein